VFSSAYEKHGKDIKPHSCLQPETDKVAQKFLNIWKKLFTASNMNCCC